MYLVAKIVRQKTDGKGKLLNKDPDHDKETIVFPNHSITYETEAEALKEISRLKEANIMNDYGLFGLLKRSKSKNAPYEIIETIEDLK